MTREEALIEVARIKAVSNFSRRYDDEFRLEEAKVDYAWRRALDDQAKRMRRRWWFWLAYAALMAGGFWIVWRAFAGWPTGYSWLQRLAG